MTLKVDRNRLIEWLFKRGDEQQKIGDNVIYQNDREFFYGMAFEDLHLITMINKNAFSSKEVVNFELLSFVIPDIMLKAGVKELMRSMI